MKKIFNVGIIGMGKLGQGTVRDFIDNAKEIHRKLGEDFSIQIKTVCDTNFDSAIQNLLPSEIERVTDFHSIINDENIDIVVELIGGVDSAYEIISSALKAKKCVVTANKALMAEKGDELCDLAEKMGLSIGIEAVVCGGLPIVHVIRDGLIGDKIKGFYGILNGATNYVLTELQRRKTDFNSAIKTAMSENLFESDPDLDIDGIDAGQKAVVLSRLCFGKKVDFSAIYCEGIRKVTEEDFYFADKLGYSIRLIAIGKLATDHNLTLSVAPTLIKKQNLLASVKKNHNAVFIEGQKTGDTFYYGKVGGGMETGIAILSDIINFARDLRFGGAPRSSALGLKRLADCKVLPYENEIFPFYIRYIVHDQPGVLAAVDEVLAWHKINVRSTFSIRDFEPEHSENKISFIMTVDPTTVSEMKDAVAEMKGLEFFKEEPFAIRIMD